MSRMTVDELVYWLAEQDPEAKFLFVEGIRDSRFWSVVVPFSERGSVTVAPIGTIELPGCAGGERGRALELAQMLAKTGVAEKVLFFLDADNDLLFKTPPPARVVWTDYRDLETYVLEGDCLKNWLYGIGKDPAAALALKNQIVVALKELGLIRAADATTKTGLPFAKAFVARADKCLVKNGGQDVVDTDKLLITLFNEAKSDADSQEKLKDAVEELRVSLEDRPDEWFVGGKDLVAYLAAVFKLTFEEAYRMIHVCMIACLETIRTLPNFAKAEAFVRT